MVIYSLCIQNMRGYMLLGQQLVDTAYVMQTRRGRDAALKMITLLGKVSGTPNIRRA